MTTRCTPPPSEYCCNVVQKWGMRASTLLLAVVFGFVSSALTSPLALAQTVCGCSDENDSMQTIDICIDGVEYEVQVVYCHLCYDEPSMQEICTPGLLSHSRTTIRQVCGQVVNLKTPRQIYDAIWCAFKPCDDVICHYPQLDDPNDFLCWEFITPRCTQVINNCLVACNNSPCCINRTRWQWNLTTRECYQLGNTHTTNCQTSTDACGTGCNNTVCLQLQESPTCSTCP